MLTNYVAAGILDTPLISMVFPTIDDWRSYKNENKVGPQGENKIWGHILNSELSFT